MSQGPVLGVIGTVVWDTIERPGHEPIHDWGGVVYSLAGAVAAAETASVRLIAKVGSDVIDGVGELIDDFPVSLDSALVEVDETNNRVEVMYLDGPHERVERLTGGVPAWSPAELDEAVEGCDALFVNFISGFEMELETAEALRATFDGPIHSDLHSLFLGVGPEGVRVPRTLPNADAWLRCFDSVQMNDAERELLLGYDSPLSDLVAGDDGPGLAFVTLGAEGALFASSASAGDGSWGPVAGSDGLVTLGWTPEVGDPTGCGDVWGGALAVRLLEGDRPRRAARVANHFASSAVGVSGAGGLARHLLVRRHGQR